MRIDSDWLGRHLWWGGALGLTLGTGGELWARAWGPTPPAPAGWSLLAAVQAGTGLAASAGAIALATLPLLQLRGGRWAARVLSATAMSALGAFHAGALLVRVHAGSHPTLSALRMLLASPVQLVDHTLESYPLATALWLLGTLALCGLWLWRLPQVRGPRASLRQLWILAALWLVHVACVTAGLTSHGRAYLRATPESALLADVVASSAAPASTPLRHGPSRALGARYMARLESLSKDSPPRPNLLLMVLESVPHDHLGFAGYPRPVSPVLDALAANSLRATRVWSTASQSNYAQMSILASLHPRRGEHLDDYQQIAYPRVLPHDIFARLGYATATISSQNESWMGMRRFQSTDTPNPILDAANHPGPHIGSGLEGKLPDHITIDRVIAWLEALPPDTPFQLYVNLQRTHFPYTLPEGFEPTFTPADPDPAQFGFLGYPASELAAARNRYDNALRYVDAQIGRLRDALEQRGLLRDTLWVITADHGESFHDQGHVTHGNSLRESQTRVPLLMHWPAGLSASRTDQPLSTLDIMPSVLSLLRLPPHPAHQGVSFVGAHGPRDHTRRGMYLTLQGLRYADAIVCYPYKLIHEANTARLFFYDLGADPHEEHNLMGRADARAKPLAFRLLQMVHGQTRYHASATAMANHFAPALPDCP